MKSHQYYYVISGLGHLFVKASQSHSVGLP